MGKALKYALFGVSFAIGGIAMEYFGVEKSAWFALYGATFVTLLQWHD